MLCVTDSQSAVTAQKRYRYPITGHGDSQEGRNVGLLSLLWYSAQLGWQSCQLQATAPLSPQ
jgi:hypothetical protein